MKKYKTSFTSKLSENEIGMILMSIAVLTIPFSDALAKWLSSSLSPIVITWGRFTFQVLVLLPFFLRKQKSKNLFDPMFIWLGLLIASSSVLLYFGVMHLPLANNIALFFIEPLVLTLISVFWLKERIITKQWVALIVGFIGALIVLRPNYSAYGIYSLYPIGAAICYAFYLALVRWVKHKDAVLLQFHSSVVAFFALSILVALGGFDILAFTIEFPNLKEWGWISILGISTTLVYLLFIMAFRHSDASTLAPFQYMEIITASLLGWLIFENIPDGFTLLGALIIVGAGLYIFKTQRALANTNAKPME
jgi:drug/metabolite transporter (DMT)-like permease